MRSHHHHRHRGRQPRRSVAFRVLLAVSVLGQAGFGAEGSPSDSVVPQAHERSADRPTRLARLARERGELTRDRLAAEEAEARVVAARARLGEVRARIAEERRDRDARSADLRAREAAEREAIAAEKAEIVRLRTALAESSGEARAEGAEGAAGGR